MNRTDDALMGWVSWTVTVPGAELLVLGKVWIVVHAPLRLLVACTM